MTENSTSTILVHPHLRFMFSHTLEYKTQAKIFVWDTWSSIELIRVYIINYLVIKF